MPPAAAVELVEREVDLGGDPADDPPAAPGQEVLGLAVGEERVQLAGQELVALELQRRDPRGARVQAERQRDEFNKIAAAAHGANFDRHRLATVSEVNPLSSARNAVTVPAPALDHVQVAAPPGCEPEARRFYGQLLGLVELEKPAPLRARGGVWFALGGGAQLHIGVEDPFAPARKAHPALRVTRRRAPGARGAPRARRRARELAPAHRRPRRRGAVLHRRSVGQSPGAAGRGLAHQPRRPRERRACASFDRRRSRRRGGGPPTPTTEINRGGIERAHALELSVVRRCR